MTNSWWASVLGLMVILNGALSVSSVGILSTGIGWAWSQRHRFSEYLILYKIETVQEARKDDEHVLPAHVPTDTDPATRAESKVSLNHVFDMFIHEPTLTMVGRDGHLSGLKRRASGYSASLEAIWKLLLNTTVPASIRYPLYSSSFLIVKTLSLGPYVNACVAPSWTTFGNIRNVSLIVALISGSLSQSP